MWNTNHRPELQGKLTADDFDMGRVHIETEDGASCHFVRAFGREETAPDGTEFFVVYTEHDGYFVFFKSDLRFAAPSTHNE